jgi:hypothetical protein
LKAEEALKLALLCLATVAWDFKSGNADFGSHTLLVFGIECGAFPNIAGIHVYTYTHRDRLEEGLGENCAGDYRWEKLLH